MDLKPLYFFFPCGHGRMCDETNIEIQQEVGSEEELLTGDCFYDMEIPILCRDQMNGEFVRDTELVLPSVGRTETVSSSESNMESESISACGFRLRSPDPLCLHSNTLEINPQAEQLKTVPHNDVHGKIMNFRLTCGLGTCNCLFIKPQNLCAHILTEHNIPTYVTTMRFKDRTKGEDFVAGANEERFKYVQIGNCGSDKKTFMCQYAIFRRNRKNLCLVEPIRGNLSSYFDEDYSFSGIDFSSRGPVVRRGGVCPAFFTIIPEGSGAVVKICDWHLHGVKIPNETVKRMACLLLLEKCSSQQLLALLRASNDTTQSSSDVNEYMQRLSPRQAQVLCHIVKSTYRPIGSVLKIIHSGLTPLEKSCIEKVEAEMARKRKEEINADIVEVYPGSEADFPRNFFGTPQNIKRNKKRKREDLLKIMKLWESNG